MLPPPKKVWNRFASKVILKLGRGFSKPSESITRTTRRFLSRLGSSDSSGRRCCRCSCHDQPEYWLQDRPSFGNNCNTNYYMEVEFENVEGEELEDEAVDEKAEEFIAKFHESLKLERLQHF
ncbi:hypothetical protein Csa_015429 [Cucumis sativus]|uniref:Uncharacterized protein n=1 Tax=Cucumis sativus TaxID=3659 RepID=A0A0A0K332_CUCSA|nr:hypothetical protein Csa_015429 [Cucumis sativus]